MKKATLEKVLACLNDMAPAVSVPENIAVPARRAIEAMLAV
jgi:quinolinate synthase